MSYQLTEHYLLIPMVQCFCRLFLRFFVIEIKERIFFTSDVYIGTQTHARAHTRARTHARTHARTRT